MLGNVESGCAVGVSPSPAATASVDSRQDSLSGSRAELVTDHRVPAEQGSSIDARHDAPTEMTGRLPSRDASPTGFAISVPLSLDRTTVARGDAIRGTVTYQNFADSVVAIRTIVIACRPPGGQNNGGPYKDMSPTLGASKVQPNMTVTLSASRTIATSDPTGQWWCYGTYEDDSHVYHDGPSVYFTVTP